MRARLVVLLLAACSSSPRPPVAAAATTTPPPAHEDLVSALAPLMPPDAMKDFDWSPEVARQPAQRVFVNPRVLVDVSATRFMTAMMAMKASLGVECAHCHDTKAYPSDDKDPKITARRMLLMARDVNDGTFHGVTRVTCWTCHRAEVKPPSAPPGFGDAIAAAPRQAALEVPEEARAKPARKHFKNLELLGGRNAGQLAGAMNAFNITLGVQCAHCHDEKDYASDAKPAKGRARDMIKLVGRINAELGSRGAVTCFTCHRGAIEPPRVPAGL